MSNDDIVWDENPITWDQPRSMTEQFMDQIKRIPRMAVNGVGGTALAVGDAVKGAAELLGKAGEKIGLPPQQPIGSPSQSVNNMLTNAGVPEDKSLSDQLTGAVGAGMFGAADPVLRAVQAALPKTPLPPSPTDAAEMEARRLMNQGINLPPSVVPGSSMRGRTAEMFAGRPAVASELANKNQSVMRDMARKELGFAKDENLTEANLQNNIDYWINKGYKPLESLPSHGNFKGIGIGSQFRQDMADIVRDYGGGDSFPLAKKNDVKELVNKYLFDERGRYLQSYSGEDVVRSIRDLRTEAKGSFQNGNNILGKAQERVAKALEDNVELNLQAMPRYQNSGLLENYRAARQEIAKSKALKDMLTDPHTGEINAQKAFSLRQSGVPLSGGLDDIARAGSPVYGASTKAPSSVSPLPPNDPGINWATRGVVMGAATQSPTLLGMGAAAGALPPVRTAMRHYLSSPYYQRKLLNNLYGGPGYLGTPAGERSAFSGLLGLIPLLSPDEERK